MGAKTRKLSQINDSLIEWQSVVVADGSTGLTAVAGRGYFINTTGGAITVTLPSATAKPGDTIQLKDYARTWGTNAVSIASNTFDGVGSRTPSFSTNGQTVTLVYMDNTQGWSLINEDTTTGLGAVFISATGGTITTSGDFKIHTFTGDGCFVVATAGNPTGSNSVDYLVVAGGGSGGGGPDAAGGGAAGGFRESKDSTINSPHTASPLAATSGITLTVQTYPITVGAGGSAIPLSPSPDTRGNNGNPSVFSTITSTAGGGGAGSGGGGAPVCISAGKPGGSGGGASTSGGSSGTIGSGNTPPTSPSQGNNGGTGASDNATYRAGGGGGGAGAAGQSTTNPAPKGGDGGAGATTSISGSPTTYAGGGGGAGHPTGSRPGGSGGPGGGGTGAVPLQATSGTVNTGGGGGAGGNVGPTSGAGGSGIVVIRYKFQ